MFKFGFLCVVTAAALIALPGSAFAGHGKAGLWEATTTPEGSPQSYNMKFCMTEADVNSEKPPTMQQPNNPCKMTNSKTVGQTYSADMVCSGQMQGTSHFEISYDKPEHYKGLSVFKGTVSGQPYSSTTKFEGKWLKADCGDVKPFTVK